MAMAFERAFGTIGKGTQMTDSEIITQLRAAIDAADTRLADAAGLLRVLQNRLEQYHPPRDGDDLTSTPIWNLYHCIDEKIHQAREELEESELINPSTVEPADA
jgi:hypothetical protein